MEWRDSPEQAAFRNDVRTFITEHLPEGLEASDRFEAPERSEKLDRWRDALVARGWIAPAWPKEYGGASLSVVEQFILNEEFAKANAPQLGVLGVMMLGPTLIAHGNEEQKKQHLSGILRGEVNWCQGYSEPGSGSDLASLQTRAIRDGDDFVVNGQKIWTSGAHRADWMFCLVRTDPDAPKHKGITYLLIDMKTPGITVRPLINMAGEHGFNEVFFEDVRVPVTNVVGEINRGWYVGATTLDFERSSIGAAVGQEQQVERAARWLREHRDAIPAAHYQVSRLKWAERWIEVNVARGLAYRIISMQAAGQIPNAEASIAKLYSTELSQRVARTMVETLGMAGALRGDEAPFKGQPALSYMSVVSMTIAGGTSEIQRNIIATRGLGLPRA